MRTQQECVNANPSDIRNGYVNYEHTWCTGGLQGRDSCSGDSGGPAIVMRDGRPWLIGVLSKVCVPLFAIVDCCAKIAIGVDNIGLGYELFIPDHLFECCGQA